MVFRISLVIHDWCLAFFKAKNPNDLENLITDLKRLDHDYRFRYHLLDHLISLDKFEEVIPLDTFYEYTILSGVGEVNFLKEKTGKDYTRQIQIDLLYFIYKVHQHWSTLERNFKVYDKGSFPQELLDLWNPNGPVFSSDSNNRLENRSYFYILTTLLELFEFGQRDSGNEKDIVESVICFLNQEQTQTSLTVEYINKTQITPTALAPGPYISFRNFAQFLKNQYLSYVGKKPQDPADEEVQRPFRNMVFNSLCLAI